MEALLIIDVQNDFLPGGALAVPEGDQIIPVINTLQDRFDLIIASKDWHPPGHISFASRHGMQPGETVEVCGVAQALWPDHCVQHTQGAEFPSSLNTAKISHIVEKGSNPEIDSYSAFFDHSGKDTGLTAYLEEQGVHVIYVVGLATDYCVNDSVRDALRLGFKVYVVKEGCRGIGDEAKALEEMQKAGAVILPN